MVVHAFRPRRVLMKGRKRIGQFVPVMGLLWALTASPAEISAQKYGVYLKIADGAGENVAEVARSVEGAVEGAGWDLLASYSAGVRAQDCSYEAHVVVVNWPEHTQVVMSQGNHGAFAAPVRISVFEDENGVHVAAVNPRSIHRTIVAEEGMEEEWDRLAEELRSTLTINMGVPPSEGEFGQFRDKGRIGRTFGIMAGGPFQEKIKTITTVEGEVEAVASRLFETLQGMEPGPEWGSRAVYLMNAGEDVWVLGMTGERMERRSFSIVGRGSDKSREDMACPGIDHTPAYPIEVVLTQEGEEVRLTLIDEMFRMKMFFEDAGKMAFARNMGMPGDIEDEVKEKILAALF
jgi:uncharacterized protein (DUF302 family)